MEWTDEAIVLSCRRHGESGAIMSVLAREHGRYVGLVRGGGGKRARGALQPGNRIQATWKARLAEQLGGFTWELLSPEGTRWLADRRRLAAVAAACALIETALPERESHPSAFAGLTALFDALSHETWASDYVRWEVALLAELGFGLDLSRCAATGTNDDLAYVSPRTGRAVSLSAGEPYREKLLPMPRFLAADGPGAADEVEAGLGLTGYFLERWVFPGLGKGLPAARTRLVAALKP